MIHTPTPWKAFVKGMGDTAIIAKNGRVVCECTFLEPLDASEFQANARLIASSPDLLAALEELERETSHAHVIGAGLPHDCAVCRAIKRARAAIEQAKG